MVQSNRCNRVIFILEPYAKKVLLSNKTGDFPFSREKKTNKLSTVKESNENTFKKLFQDNVGLCQTEPLGKNPKNNALIIQNDVLADLSSCSIWNDWFLACLKQRIL